MKFKAKAQDCFLYVKVKTDFGEKIDEKALDAFSRLGLRGFMKPKMSKKSSAEFVGPIGESLLERLKQPITRREFLFIMEHLVVAIQKLQANNLSLINLVLDIEHTYINKVTKEVQFLYIPIVNKKPGASIFEYIETIIYSARPMDAQDADCISKFVYFIKSLKYYDSEKVEEYIARQDKSVVNTIKKHNVGQSGYMTDKPQHYYEHYDKKAEAAAATTTATDVPQMTVPPMENPQMAPLQTTVPPVLPTEVEIPYPQPTAFAPDFDEATGLLEEPAWGVSGEDDTALLVEEDENETALLVDETEDENETALLVEEPEVPEPVVIHYPTMTRISTDETFSIDKPVFRIGKENSYVDFFVSNNINVSRSHADVITRGEQYYIVDLNSKNHSYINGQRLTPQCETEIHDGDTLRLANEDFIFHI